LLALSIERFPPQNGFRFVFDHKPEMRKLVNEHYANAKRLVDAHLPGKFAAENVAFADDERVLPLQMADLLVYEWRKRTSDKVKTPNKPVRKSYERIRAATYGNRALCHYSAEAIASIGARADAGESFIELMWKSPTTAD
jgi:hypothetical protein